MECVRNVDICMYMTLQSCLHFVNFAELTDVVAVNRGSPTEVNEMEMNTTIVIVCNDGIIVLAIYMSVAVEGLHMVNMKMKRVNT